MTKFKLNLDALAVESFDTEPARRGYGTVRGHAGDAIDAGEPAVAAPITNVMVDCGSWIDACPSRIGTCDTCKESCLGSCVSCATCPATSCASQYPSCPTGLVCEA